MEQIVEAFSAGSTAAYVLETVGSSTLRGFRAVGNAVVIRGVVGGRIQGIELASDGWVNVRMKLGLMVNDLSLYRRTDSVFVQLQGLLMDLRANPTKYISVRLF